MFRDKKIIFMNIIYTMASVSDFMFNNMARIGNDNCGQSQRNVQNVKSGNYTLTNPFNGDCLMNKGINFALEQPNVNYTGTKEMAPEGCNVDINSKLKIGSEQTHPKCKLSLEQRPYLTVPFLGRGPGNALLESQILQGEQVTNRKSITNVTEKSHMVYSNTPMIPSLAASINNPANLIENSASEGWIRGGLPSRELTKDYDYFTTHTKNQY